MSLRSSTVIRVKGLADIVVAAVLVLKPGLIYDSFAARAIGQLSGLHLSSASKAPGFNHSIACMVASVGVGHVVASSGGKGARRSILAMNVTWSFLCLLSCIASPEEWGWSSATLLMTGMSHALFSLLLLLADEGGGKRKAV